MKKQLIHIIFALALILYSRVGDCQEKYLGKFEGQRSVQIINILRHERHFMINARDSASGNDFIILSDKDGNAKCDSGEVLTELKVGKYYSVDLITYPIFPFTLPKDSLIIMFDSRRVEASLYDTLFNWDNLPHMSTKINKDRICIGK